ncbi:MAG: bifunctional phosphopantothenoylcysteine decarboxylase/phosphopantothenate--cysteine ligase CoaBC, partial [Nitrospirota bacterium]
MGLAGKKIILGVTGSIAAYKSVYLLRRFVEHGADVSVVMTPEAAKFVTPLTFQVLSKNTVYTDMFESGQGGEISHLYLGRGADMVLIAPATANIIGKMANGIADDLLSTILLACKCPVLVAPAMDSEMYDNRVVQKNISYLQKLNVDFIGPVTGPLASGIEGPGRMSEPDVILAFVEERLADRACRDIEGHTILVTAGPTREAIDPVRYISNLSSGKMGYSIAEAAKRRGAKVILISGPVSLTPPAGVELVRVITAEEMFNAVINRLPEVDVVVMAAAVSDFKPAVVVNSKIKKGNIPSFYKESAGGITLNLVKTQDILSEILEKKGKQFIVGFAAETEDMVANAKKKLISKQLDMIVANDVCKEGAGFEVDTNIVTVIDRWGETVEYPVMTKAAVADKILDHVVH